MFERFTDEARKAMAMANQEAMRAHQEFIGAEHILLAISRNGTGLGGELLKEWNMGEAQLRPIIEKLFSKGDAEKPAFKIPIAPPAKLIIERAIAEARARAHKSVSTEHLLLGILVEGGTVIRQIFEDAGISVDEVAKRVDAAVVDIDEVKTLDTVAALWLRLPAAKRDRALTMLKALLDEK